MRFICMSLLCCLVVVFGGCNDSGLPKSKQGQYRWMSMYLPWLDESMLSSISGSHVKRSQEPEINLDKCGGYVVYIALGSNMYNCYAVVRIDSKGRAVACYQDVNSRKYMQKSIDVQHDTMKTLHKILVKNGAGKLSESYVDTKITDGTQGGFTLLTRKGIRRTFMSNEWPDEFRNIALFVQNNILKYADKSPNPGFVNVRKSMIQDDPEATKAVRGLIR